MAEEQSIELRHNKRRLVIIIGVAAALLIGSAAAAFFMFGTDSTGLDVRSNPRQAAATTLEPVAYVNIPEPFVFNLRSEPRDRMVQIKAHLMVRGRENERLARYHSPLIESSIINTFTSSTEQQLRSQTGRAELRDRATDDVQAILSQTVGTPVVERVLFTDFVIQ